MSRHPTILCVIDPDRWGGQVLAQALEYARKRDAHLIVAHVVDHHTGFESDHAPFLSPRALNAELAVTALELIQEMLPPNRGETPVIVQIGPARQTVVSLARTHGADLVMVGSHNPFGLKTAGARTPAQQLPFHVLSVQVKRSWHPLRMLRRPHRDAGSAETASRGH